MDDRPRRTRLDSGRSARPRPGAGPEVLHVDGSLKKRTQREQRGRGFQGPQTRTYARRTAAFGGGPASSAAPSEDERPGVTVPLTWLPAGGPSTPGRVSCATVGGGEVAGQARLRGRRGGSGRGPQRAKVPQWIGDGPRRGGDQRPAAVAARGGVEGAPRRASGPPALKNRQQGNVDSPPVMSGHPREEVRVPG